MVDDRVSAAVNRLISNLPAACKVLEEEGYHGLAGQLRRDCEALRWWQERGGLGLGGDVAEACAGPKPLPAESAPEWARPTSSGAEWNLDVEGEVVE